MQRALGCWVSGFLGFSLAASLIVTAGADDFSTTNRNCLSRFWLAAAQTNRPITVLSFGDSMADSYQSASFAVISFMVARFGITGYSFNNYGNETLPNFTNSAYNYAGPSPYWFNDAYQIYGGGGLWWESQSNPNGVYSDKLGVFWVSQPDGGSFTFSVSTAGGPWTTMLTLNSYSPTLIGNFTNVVVAPDFHRVRVDGIAGMSFIVGPQLMLQHGGGVHVAFMDKGGLDLGSVTNVPLAVREPILAGLAPDLLIWAMKEDGSVSTSNRLIECENWWSNAVPACDVLYIGTPYVAADTNPATAVTMSQNRLVRQTAVTYHRAYCDLMTPSVSWPWMNSQGYMLDDVHENYAGGQFLGHMMWNDMGFFALGAPQTLALQIMGQTLQLQFPTSTGIWYTLQTSANLVNWQTITSAAGTGQNTSTNVSFVPPTGFFRLQLDPN